LLRLSRSDELSIVTGERSAAGGTARRSRALGQEPR
jgi:hypothetical protein